MNKSFSGDKEIVYWYTKDGRKLDVDKMSIKHLRNTLKMIIRNCETEDDKRIFNSEYLEYINPNWGAHDED